MVAQADGPEVDADLREQLVEEHHKYSGEGDEDYEERKKELGESSVNESIDKDGKDKVSHYDDIKHPNMELSDGAASEMGVDT